MGIIRENKQIISGNPDFVRFIQVIMEEPEIRETLKAILILDDFNRRSALNTWLEEFRFNQAPPKFLATLSCLLDKGVALKTLEIIQE
jgi:hypothetical protein